MARQRKGDVIGRWSLDQVLGSGGNAEVWRALNEDNIVALKILNQRRVTSEPYARFRQEIDALTRIGTMNGVVPLIDSSLPAVPTDSDPAWIAMPIGRPLADDLSRKTLREVVDAVAGIAETLAELGDRFAIHHRDIKPANLYVLEGRPAISDFGLVDLPDAVDLTLAGQPLGPRYFLAYEMLMNPMEADPSPADVFSLAKTLWVLAVDQRWPPQGEQYASNAAYLIGRFRPHPLAHLLDELIERCTRHQSSERPPMHQVADDLRAWLTLDLATPQAAVDLADAWRRLRETAEPRLREVRDEARSRECFQRSLKRFQELLAPLHSDIRRNFPAAEFNQQRKFVETMFYEWPQHETVHEDVRATILSDSGWNPVRLIIGTAIRAKSDGSVSVSGLYYLGRTETMGGQIDHWQSDPVSAPCGSVAIEARLSELTTTMQHLFPDWLSRFTDALASEND